MPMTTLLRLRIGQALCGLCGHVMVRHFEPSRMSLQCLVCGAETHGWSLRAGADDGEDAGDHFGDGHAGRVDVHGVFRESQR